MNKKIIIIGSFLLIGLLAGCDQIPQIKQLKEAYLQTRVVQFVTQMATKAYHRRTQGDTKCYGSSSHGDAH